MKNRTKLVIGLLLVLPLMAGVASVVASQKAISEAKQERQKLVAAAAECERLESENKQLSQVSVPVKRIKELKEENAELPKLRNEIRQLRRQAEELEKLREENKRLLMVQKGIGKPVIVTAQEKFIPKAALVDAGLATPEATLQTMAWAQYQGNIRRLLECCTPSAETREMLLGNEATMSQAMKTQMNNFSGFRIAEKRIISDNEIEMGIQMSTTGSVMRIPLRRVGTEWKVDQ